ncbi:hypothetical protein Tco_1510718, partial [Tanacetum coccineum]
DYLDGTDTESEPFEDPIDKKTLESPLTIAPPTSLSDSVPPLVPILRRTVRMAVCVPPAMLSGLSANMAEVTTMPGSAFIRGLSPLTRVRHLCHRQTFLYGSVIGDAKDKGSTVEDEDPAARDEGLAAGVEGLEEEEEVVPGGQQQAAPVVGTVGSGSAPESERPERVSASRQPTLTTWTDLEDDMVYIDDPAYPPPAPHVQTPPSPEWTSGSLPISPSPFVVPSPVSLPMISLTVPSPVATAATAETEGFLTELGAQVKMQGGLIRDHAIQLEELSSALFEDRDIGELFTRLGAVRDEIFSQRYRFRSLEYEQKRVTVTFEVIRRLVLALESWAGQTDA